MGFTHNLRSLRSASCALLALLVAASSHAADTQGARTLKLASSIWAPYVDESRPNNGLAIDLVTSALQNAGYKVEPHLRTWPRAYEGVASGVDDVVAAVWQTEEREADLAFSEPYLLNDIIFLGRRGETPSYESLDDLEGLRIGVVNKYAYGGGFDDHPRLTRVGNNALIQNILLLQLGKLDLVIGDQWSIFYEISQYLPDTLQEFDVMRKPLVRRGLRLGVSRQNPQHEQIVKDFNQAIRALHDDGSYREILKRHTEGIAVIAQTR